MTALDKRAYMGSDHEVESLVWPISQIIVILEAFSAAGEGSPGGEGDPRWPKGAKSAAQHLRDVFYRMGFNDQEIVALSGSFCSCW